LAGAEFRVLRFNDPSRERTRPCLETPALAVDWIRSAVASETTAFRADVENFLVVSLTVRHHAIGIEIVTTGILDTVLIHPREVFRTPILIGAHGIIVAHNHPSGDPSPSNADISATHNLVRAGQILKIPVWDHLVFTPDKFVSLRELGLVVNP
jgi:DNA repair protein RadC